MPDTAKPNSLAEQIERIAHHDIMIESLAGRMRGVENGLKSLATDVQKGFSDIGRALAQFEGQKGPGIGKILGTIAMGGGIVGMSATAITILVQSFIAPQISKMQTVIEQHQVVIQRVEDDRRDEVRGLRESLKAYRQAETARSDERQKRLEERLGWGSGLAIKKD